jgi:hypothetical protein
MGQDPRYVAWGLLTDRDLERLGSEFRMAFPLDSASAFDDLLTVLDQLTDSGGRPGLERPPKRG